MLDKLLHIELLNQKYINLSLNNKLKSQSKKIAEQIEKNNKYKNVLTIIKNNIKKQHLVLNKSSEIVINNVKPKTLRKCNSCNDI